MQMKQTAANSSFSCFCQYSFYFLHKKGKYIPHFQPKKCDFDLRTHNTRNILIFLDCTTNFSILRLQFFNKLAFSAFFFSFLFLKKVKKFFKFRILQ